MRLYNVVFSFLNGRHAFLKLWGEDDTIVTKVKHILQDNEGGSAEVYGFHFRTFIAV